MYSVVVRTVATLVALSVATLAFRVAWRLGVERYLVEIQKKGVEARTLAANDGVYGVRSPRIIAENIRATEDAIRKFPGDVDLYLELGANLRLKGDLPGAERAYRDALKVSRRPEIFVNLGEVELAQSDLPGALEAYGAVYEHNPIWVDHLRRPLVQLKANSPDRTR